MDIEQFTELADRLMERVPEPVLEGLNGGVTIRRNARREKDDPKDVFIMGEYVTDPVMGCYVVLYYGSFQAILNGEPDSVWEEELWETIRHELRHHLEYRAGESDLDREDEEQLFELRKRSPRDRK
ncbi:MAG TPA: metallopeptidase family protein [Symbiobacteriaceae bacterium]|nr:metallopeptidase family protein [Symbiobacteriaceae bacterium]